MCHAGKALKQWMREYREQRKEDGVMDEDEDDAESSSDSADSPCIVIMDSLNGTRKSTDFALLRKWLNLQAVQWIENEMKNDKMENDADTKDDGEGEYNVFTATDIVGCIAKVPEQPDGHNCGCFLLRNVLQFGKERGFEDTSSKKNFNLKKWYSTIKDGVAYREEIATIIARLMEEQKGIHLKLRRHFESKEKDLIREQLKRQKERAKEKSKSLSP